MPNAPFPTEATTVSGWIEHLSPASIAGYVLTSYNSLLSWSAAQLLMREDYVSAAPERGGQGQSTANTDNLRQALTHLYPQHTLAIWCNNGQGHIAITVPQGEGTQWPSSIAYPC